MTLNRRKVSTMPRFDLQDIAIFNESAQIVVADVKSTLVNVNTESCFKT